MAPVAQPPNANGGVGVSQARFTSWLEKFGEAEYSDQKNQDATISDMSYEEWTKSTQALGPYLLHVTMDIWDESTSNEDETSEVEDDVVNRPRMSTRPKIVTTNGYGMRQAAKASKPAPRQITDGAAGSTKRKKKPKKHSLSQELVKSDDDSDAQEAPVHGRRKSGNRKKKQFLSEATIAPEDMDDDATSTDAIAVTTVDSAPPELETPTVATTAKSPKKKSAKKTKKKSMVVTHQPMPIGLSDKEQLQGSSLQESEDASTTQKLATPHTVVDSPDGPGSMSASRRGLRARTAAQQNPYQHHAKLFEDQLSDEESNQSNVEAPPKKQTIKLKHTLDRSAIDQNEPLPFEDVVVLTDRSKDAPPSANKTHQSKPEVPTWEEPTEDLDDVLVDEDGILAEREDDLPPSGKRHYKGKGRAWRKTEEDEDEDFMTKTKVRTPKQPKRMVSRRKSTQLTAVHAQDGDEGEGQTAAQPTPEAIQSASVAVASPSEKPPRKKPGPKPGFKRAQAALGDAQRDQGGAEQASQSKKEKTPKIKKEKTKNSPVTTPGSLKKTGKHKSGPRRSSAFYLSEEFILNSSDTELDEQPATENGPDSTIEHTTPARPAKARRKHRRSDQSTLSKATVDSDDDAESVKSAGEETITPAPTAGDEGTGPTASTPAVVSEQPSVENPVPTDETELPPSATDGNEGATVAEVESTSG